MGVPIAFLALAKDVKRLADHIGMPGFTIDGCRHGGSSKIGEAGMTDICGMALTRNKTVNVFPEVSKRH